MLNKKKNGTILNALKISNFNHNSTSLLLTQNGKQSTLETSR